MLTYSLWLDNELVRQAPFFEGLTYSYAFFGDSMQGGGPSGAWVKWDYFRFSVIPASPIPEPGSLTLLLGVCACRLLRCR